MRAGNNIDIKENDISIEINYYNAWRSVDPIDQLRTQLGEILTDYRLILVFRDAQLLTEKLRAQLGRELWRSCLSRFVNSGVLLVCLYESNCGLDVVDDIGFPPAASVIIDLPLTISEPERPEAIKDVATIALERGWYLSELEATAFAEGKVINAPSIRWLHTSLFAFAAYKQKYMTPENQS